LSLAGSNPFYLYFVMNNIIIKFLTLLIFRLTPTLSQLLLVNLLIISLFFTTPERVQADVVKPALIEISVNAKGFYKIEIRASIEAILTGIDGRYKNTQDSPNAQAYDELRVLEAEELEKHFNEFIPQFIQSIVLKFDDKPSELKLDSIIIPEPGYPKVPRTSIIKLQGSIPRTAKTLTWYYPARFGDNAVRVRQVDEEKEKWHWSQWQWLKKDQPSSAFSLTEVFGQLSTYEIFSIYVIAGFEHILPKGLDHILFILGIFLLSLKLKLLVWQVTMFTLAHTITLGLSINGIINVPAYIVEPLIALSIAYIGLENSFSKSLQNSRLFIIFCFGLLHGMGFASVLTDFGMPADSFVMALISFNIGVELGQLAIITLAFALVGYWFRNKAWYRQVIIIPASATIATIGLYWTYDRIIIS